jgi:pimeloyl-ACP methyl ester carboxylesterase
LNNKIEERALDVGEFRVNYGSVGKGPYMTLLHGSDKRENWKVWEPFVPLSDAFTMVMPDLVGYGRSSTPVETPDYRTQARVTHELMDRIGIQKTVLVGASWGGQVALEVAINWPESVESMVLIASTYDKAQVPKMPRIRRPTLIIWAEDDLVAQLKAGYLLRDAIRTSRLEVLDAVARDPNHDFTMAHKLWRYKSDAVLAKMREFLSSAPSKVVEPPELEPELKGLALKQDKDEG